MSHLRLFGVEVAAVVAIGRNYDRHPLGDFDAVTVKPRDLAGIVGHEPHLVDPEIDEHLGAFAVIAFKANHFIFPFLI